MQKNSILRTICAGLLSVSMLMGVAAAQTTAPTAEMNDSTVSVSYTETGEGYGTIVYLFEGKVEPDTYIDEELLNQKLVWAGVGVNGTAEFILPDTAEYGVYTIVIGAKGMPYAKADRTFYVFKVEDGVVEVAIDTIAGSADEDVMADNISAYNNFVFSVDEDILENNKKLVYELIMDSESIDVRTVEKSVDIASALSNFDELASNEAADILAANKELLEMDEDFEAVALTVASALGNGKFEDAEELADYKKIIRTELALATVNYTETSKVYDIIEKYNDILEVDFDKIDKLSSTDKRELEKFISNYNFEDAGEIADVISDKVKEINKKPEKNTGSGGGSSSGGGGRGSYIAPTKLAQPTVEKINETPPVAASVNDLEGFDWAEEAILYLSENNIMNGDGNGSFRPGDFVTREELAKLVVTAFGPQKLDDAKIGFADVDAEAWYAPYIIEASSKGIVNGISKDYFGVGEIITRQDAAVMIQRATDAYSVHLEKKQTLVSIADFESIADYAKISIDILVRAQIINGYEDGTFRPNENITRAEIAKILYSCLNQ